MTEHDTEEVGRTATGNPDAGHSADLERDASTRTVVCAIASAERSQFEHRHTATRRKRALVYLGLALLAPLFVGFAFGAYRLGRWVAGGGGDGLVALARWYLPALLGMYALYGTDLAGRRLVDFGARELLLTTVRDRDLVLGLLYADLREATWAMYGPTAGLVVAFALGVGSPATAVVATAATLLGIAAAVSLGYVVGLVGRLALRRVALSTGAQTLIGGLGQVAYVVVFAIGGVVAGSTAARLELTGDAPFADLVPQGPPPVPVGYYADLLFLGTGLVKGISLATIASAAVVVAAVPLGVRGVVALAPRLWYADPVEPGAAGSETSDRSDVAELAASRRLDRDWPWLASPTGYVADGVVRRTVRSPHRLAHLAYYAVAASVLAVSAVADPAAAPTFVGGACLLFGLWVAGGAVGLNPLGDEGAMLEQIVLVAFPSRAFVRARLVVGVLLGAPFVLLGTALLSVRVFSPTEAVLVGAFWLGMLPVSAGFALGVGSFLPRTEPGQVLDAIEARPPESVAIAAHAVVIGALAVGGAFLLVSDLEVTLRWGLTGAVALVAVAAADAGYRFAVGAITDYGRPRRPDAVYAVELALALTVLGLVLSQTVRQTVAMVVPAGGTPPLAASFVGAYLGWATAGLAYLVVSGRGRSWLDARLPTGADGRHLAAGLVASFVVYGGFLAGVALFDLPVVEHSLAHAVADGGPEFALVLVGLVALVTASVEEFLFRNVIQKRLAEAVAERRAIGVAALAFAVVHVPAYYSADPLAVAVTLAPLVLLGVVWGWAYSRTRNLVVPVLCHGVYNAVAFGLAALPAV